MSDTYSARISANSRRMSGIPRKKPEKLESAPKSNDNHVNVAVRCRPMSEKEISDGHKSIVEFESPSRIVVHDISESPSDQLGTKSGERCNYSHVYDFNAVFDCNATQRDVYDRVCRPLVNNVLEGYNGTIFAYGQTGTGKTYTMEGVKNRSVPNAKATVKDEEGSEQKSSNKILNGPASQRKLSSSSRRPSLVNDGPIQTNDHASEGIIPRAFKQIFDHVARASEIQFLIRASYLEIYQEEIHDLLRKDRSIKLELHERPDVGVYVKDLTSFVCKSITEIERVMRVGNQNRRVGATDMNEHSSRSHAIFMITVEQQQQQKRQQPNGNTTDTNESEIGKLQKHQERVIRVGKLNLVDLAGSERQRKTNSFGQRQRESIKINLSLSALGNVINSLMQIHNQQQSNKTTGANDKTNDLSGFTPYRDSKLTRLLQDSLGGNAKTLMIANIGPASYNYDETINTLNYASGAKCIRNRPRLNDDPKDALLRELQREIDELRSKLAALNNKTNNVQPTDKNTSKLSELRIRDKKKSEVNDDDDQQTVEREFVELKQKLSSLESKLLNGDRQFGRNGALDPVLLQGYTYEQELELQKSKAELANQATREKAIRDELERREEAEMMAKESFSSIQQEVDAKRRLIRQILLKIKAMRNEIEATQGAYRLELDELDQLQYVLHKELKLKCLIMDNFIPNNHVDLLLPHIVYEEKRNYCYLKPVDLPLDYCNLRDPAIDFKDFWQPSDGCCIRPKSEFERMGEAIYPNNIRYKYENLIDPTLELPKQEPSRQLGFGQTGHKEVYEDENQAELRVQKLIEEALDRREPDIVI